MIVDLQTLLVFIPIALALNLTPGADMLFCLGQGIKSGPKAGVAASLGIATGSFLHSLAAGLGLAAAIAAYPLAYEVVRWAGVVYLTWLAIASLREPLTPLAPAKVKRSEVLAAWRSGILVNLLNPKVALFILALVPQFVDPARGSVLLQFLVLGLVLNVGGTVINGLFGGFAGQIGGFLARRALAARILKAVTGLVFLGLALRLATDRR
ncbi:MAG: LysE family translocator [Rhodospirillales bacterium]